MPSTTPPSSSANSLYARASLYDAQYATATHDFRFYQKLAAKTGGPILELGAGTGRLTHVLARAGFEVTALDASEAMLREARWKIQKSVHFVCADFRAFHLNRRYPLILSAFNSLQHCLRTEDFAAVLARTREHLAPGGFFAFDVPNGTRTTDRAAGTPPKSPTLRERFYDERSGQACEVWENSHSTEGPIRTLTWEYRWADGRIQQESLCLRDFSPMELRGCLADGGFRVLQHLGDFNGAPFHAVSSKQIFVSQTV